MATAHRWNIYRSGGVDQVALTTGEDLVHLDKLDPKLWIALSMPTRGVELDARTLDLLDTDKDGFVRQPEVLAAIKWLKPVYKDLGQLYEAGDSVPLARLADGPVLAAARRLLANLGKPDATAVSLSDATSAEKMFADTVFNGDGVIIAASGEGEVRRTIEDIIATYGSVQDRSSKPGVDRASITAFFADANAVLDWHKRALPFGPDTAALADAVRAVAAKIDDFFTRCRVAAYDPRAVTALDAQDAELAILATKSLSLESAELASLPLARVSAGGSLPLGDGANPAWHARLEALAAAAIGVLGARTALTEADWQTLRRAIEPFEAWRTAKPASKLDALDVERIHADVLQERAVFAALEQDLAVAGEIDRLGDVERVCRYQRDLVTLLHNYVNFSRFYSRQSGVFQAGTLYLDGRGCTLVFEVTDASKHGAMAPMAGAYIAYCDCVRAGVAKKTIAAAFTAGDIDNLFVGRNGVFVDRKGLDWQATITKVIDAPISLRQAFWSPYKKLVRAIEERVAKRAAAAESAANAKLDATAGQIAEVGKAPPADAKPGVDIGTVAALGVAVGGIAAVATSALGGVFGLGAWAPLGLVAIMVAISTPSMVLAFIKLRRRNLGPLLDANGWAINALTRINVPFGTALTDRATIPPGATRSLKDPYAEKRRPWGLYILVIAFVALAAAWYFGRLDPYLPEGLDSHTVFGPHHAPPAKDATP